MSTPTACNAASATPTTKDTEMKQDEQTTHIPDFIFCGVCLAARDVTLTADGNDGIVEQCTECGDDEYLLFDLNP